ncbi:uncharacterized protein LOC120332381 [Styela clava]
MNTVTLAQEGVFQKDPKECIEFLRKHRLLADHMVCPNCNEEMREERFRSRNKIEYRWRCKKTICRTIITIRNSIFEGSKANLRDLVLLMYYWANEFDQERISNETGLSDRTIAEWEKLLRGVCSRDLDMKGRLIGGIGRTVSIDETQIVRRNASSNRGSRPVKALWLLGGVESSSKKLFLELVPEETGRTAPTMLRLIAKNVARGTRIWTDQFPSYNKLEQMGMGYIHETVNHSIEYVSPMGVHTNEIESLWGEIKKRFRAMNGVARHMVQSYLDEWVWKRQFTKSRYFSEILRAIANNPLYKID